ncbi:hypothetical protein FRB97_007814 [Tulasnella sp. 331]|nr:hypothetical protein FRB97_007814 [Tulasnella sp. 331]
MLQTSSNGAAHGGYASRSIVSSAWEDGPILLMKKILAPNSPSDDRTLKPTPARPSATQTSRSNGEAQSGSYNSSGDVQYGVFKGDPRLAANFRSLDRLVAVDFLANLPVGMKSCLGVQQSAPSMHAGRGYDSLPPLDIDGSALDTDLYLVHLVPHA